MGIEETALPQEPRLLWRDQQERLNHTQRTLNLMSAHEPQLDVVLQSEQRFPSPHRGVVLVLQLRIGTEPCFQQRAQIARIIQQFAREGVEQAPLSTPIQPQQEVAREIDATNVPPLGLGCMNIENAKCNASAASCAVSGYGNQRR